MRSGTDARSNLSRLATDVAKEPDALSGVVLVVATRVRSWVIS